MTLKFDFRFGFDDKQMPFWSNKRLSTMYPVFISYSLKMY
jgi:hypothetical protein